MQAKQNYFSFKNPDCNFFSKKNELLMMHCDFHEKKAIPSFHEETNNEVLTNQIR